MSALDYSALVDSTVAILRNDARLDGHHVDSEPEDPTMEQCPAILVDLRGFHREPMTITAGPSVGAPYKETIRLDLACWAFAAESAGDAKRQCAKLVTTTMGVLADNFLLGGRVSIAHVLRGDFETRSGKGGIFARAILGVECLALT